MTEQTTTNEFANLPRTAKEAIAAGQTHYFTGKPCKHGHIAPRFVCDHTCVECDRARSRQYQRQRREAAKRLQYLDSLPRSRQEAWAQGSRFYYTGPCKHGHDSERYTANGDCMECRRLWNEGVRYNAKGASVAEAATVKPAVDLTFIGSVPADVNPLVALLVAQGFAVRLEVRQ